VLPVRPGVLCASLALQPNGRHKLVLPNERLQHAGADSCLPACQTLRAGGDDNTAQSVVSRSKLTLPETDNKGQAAENFISLVGNNGIIEKRKLDNTLQTLSRSYDLAEAMLIDALTGAPLSTAGRIRFTVDANNDIDIEMTLFYPNSVSEAERQADAEAGTDRVRQLSDEGTYTQALRNAGNEAGFDGDAVTLAEFEVESPGEGAASALKAGLIGACASVVMLLFLA